MIYLLIPLYNEAENVERLSSEIRKLSFSSDDFFIVFSDDGSKDSTVELLQKFFHGLNFFIIQEPTNSGPGSAFNKGFNYVLKRSTSDDDVVITLEADCTSDFNLINKMFVVSSLGFDLVLASVYAQGGGFEGTAFFRKIISSVANLFFRYFFELRVLTLSSFFRLYKVSILKKIKQKNGKVITENGFICMLEILLKAVRCEAKMVELPMTLYSKNRKGKSKMKILSTSIDYARFFFRNWNR
jgi:dolichol-phosphate mannosyltransferase